MAGIRLSTARPELNRDAYRRILLGVRHQSRPAMPAKPNYRRNIALMIVFCAAVLFAVKAAAATATYAVTLDGKVLGAIEDKTACDSIVQAMCEDEAFLVGAQVTTASQITVEPNKDKELPVLTSEEMAQAIRDNITFLAKGSVITVNGQEIVALASEEEARGVISDLRGEYIQAIMSSEGATVEDVFIREDVGILEKDVPTGIFKTRGEAVLILSRGTDKIMNYTVRRGDSLWAIAEANHLAVDDLIKANPEVGDGELIQEGQNINLVVPEPYVTVASKEIVVFTVSIPYSVDVSYNADLWPWQETVIQSGKSGQKEVTQEVTRENGREVSRVTVSERVLSNPVTRKISRGSKQVPPMASGEMAWPVQGAITSYYGWRWGSFHQGVDIGAGSGTPIIAADAGMVSLAGWNGGYGNLVKIDHGGGKETWYGHMSKMAVSVGDTVSKGDVIGYVGSTGNSTGPHLHFEVHEGGSSKNPLNYYK